MEELDDIRRHDGIAHRGSVGQESKQHQPPTSYINDLPHDIYMHSKSKPVRIPHEKLELSIPKHNEHSSKDRYLRIEDMQPPMTPLASIDNDPVYIVSPRKTSFGRRNSDTSCDSGMTAKAVSEATYVPHHAPLEANTTDPNQEAIKRKNKPFSRTTSQSSASTLAASKAVSEPDTGSESEFDSESENESDSDIGSQYPLSVELKPFKNKAGGHTAIFQFSHRAVCKILQNRENTFYETVEKYHQELLSFMPKYIGVLNVRHTLISQDEKDSCCPQISRLSDPMIPTKIGATRTHSHPEISRYSEVVLNENMHILPSFMRSMCTNQSLSKDINRSKSAVKLDECRPSTVRWSTDDRLMSKGATSVNRDLRDLILKEVFVPEKAHRHYGDHKSSSDDECSEATNTSERFILLEDLTHNRKKPCVLDLKMGTRQYGIDATPAKQHSQMTKCQLTTSKSYGVRICGMKVRNSVNDDLLFKDKYFGRDIKGPLQFRFCLMRFLYDQTAWSVIKHIPKLEKRVRKLRGIIESLVDYRFYGASLLIVFDQMERKKTDISIRVIDFAQCVTAENYPETASAMPKNKNQADAGFLLGLETLMISFHSIYKELTGSDYSSNHFSTLDPNDFLHKLPDLESFDANLWKLPPRVGEESIYNKSHSSTLSF